MRTRHAILAALLLLPLFAALPAAGEEAGEPTFQGELLGGAELLGGDEPESSKLEEYRDVPDGLVLPGFRFDFVSATGLSYWNLEGTDVGEEQQGYAFGAGRHGLWSLDLSWDQIPHRRSYDSVLIHTPVSANEFRLSAADQANLAGLAGDQAAVDAAFAALTRDFDLEQREDTLRMELAWTPRPEWRLRFLYTREEQDGYRPFGGTITFFDVNEVPTPVEYGTDRVEASAEWAHSLGFASVRLGASQFDEGLTSFVWDHPFQEEDPRRSFQGAAGLPPDNESWDIALAGGLNLGRTQRVVATLSFASWTQDELFLPATINSDISAPPLPRESLDGRIETTLADVRYTARPHRKLGVRAFLRNYHLDNDTDQVVFEDVVVSDDFLQGERWGTLPVGYQRTNAGFGLDYDLTRGVSLGFEYEWEEWDRDLREVDSTSEDTGRLTLDVTRNPKIAFRVRAEVGKRDHDNYDQARVLQYVHPDDDYDDLATHISPDLRKFDQAERDREEIELTAQWSPVEPVIVSAAYSYRSDDYPGSELGLRKERSNGTSLDVAWAPNARVSVYGNWARETLNWDSRQRYRSSTRNDDPLDDWSSHNRDRIVTWGVGARAELVPDRIDWDLGWSRSYARGKMRNDFVPGGNGAAEDIEDFPAVSNDRKRLDTTFRFLCPRGWEVRAGYAFEEYDTNDFKIDPVVPYMYEYDTSGRSRRSSYMGAGVDGYSADIYSILVGYSW